MLPIFQSGGPCEAPPEVERSREVSRGRYGLRGVPTHLVSNCPLAGPSTRYRGFSSAWTGAVEGRLWVDTEEVFGRGKVSFWRLLSTQVFPGLGAGLLEKEAWKAGLPWPALGLQRSPKKHVGLQGDFLIPISGLPVPQA